MSTLASAPIKGKPQAVSQMPETLESALHAMNREFVLIERLPGIAVIPTPSDPTLHIYSRGELVQSVCANRFIGRTNIADAWMKWPKRRTVKRLTYAPGEPLITRDALNTWVPSPIEPVKGDLTLWFAYLDHIFATDSTHRAWFIAWLAYQFQHPGTKLHSACVFWSTETGTGKSFFGYLMSALFGEHNFSEINEGQLHGNFNHWAARKQFVMGEEIRGANAQRNADFLKALITRKTVTINTKNTPHYDLPDCINYFFTSNHAEAFYLDETDRRFFVHELGAAKLDAGYVNQTLQPWLENGGYAAILHYLKHEVDLTLPVLNNLPFNPYAAAPQSKARRAMIEASRDVVDVWLDDLIDAPPANWTLATSEDLFTLFHSAYPDARLPFKTFTSACRRRLPLAYNGHTLRLTDGRRKRLFRVTSDKIIPDASLVTHYEMECGAR